MNAQLKVACLYVFIIINFPKICLCLLIYLFLYFLLAVVFKMHL